MNSAECRAEFRVEKQDLPRLVAALQLPPVLRCEQRSICEDIEGLCMLLKRVAYPCRLSDMIPRFGRPVSVISLITNDVIDYIYDVHGHLITQWNQDLLNHGALQRYADAISGQGAPLDNRPFAVYDHMVQNPPCWRANRPLGHPKQKNIKLSCFVLDVPVGGLLSSMADFVPCDRKLQRAHCFGFVDGTVRPISRPDERQRIVYNGHKRVHALKFQSLSLPNGLIGNLYGPVGEAFLRTFLLLLLVM